MPAVGIGDGAAASAAAWRLIGRRSAMPPKSEYRRYEPP